MATTVLKSSSIASAKRAARGSAQSMSATCTGSSKPGDSAL
jgi:hypothetical protein